MQPDEQATIDDQPQDGSVPCQFVSGRAGTGKTFWARERITADPTWGILSATTGIAALNLDTVTINSLLRYYDTDSLRDLYLAPYDPLTSRLYALRQEYRNLVIDEVSMMEASQLEMIYYKLRAANERPSPHPPMGLILIGDYAQLPPVEGKFAFEADCWPSFEASTLRLEKVWRQEQMEFLNALNSARRGEGAVAASLLSAVGVQWHSSRDIAFDGTTIVPTNSEVKSHNDICLMGLPGRKFWITSQRWGEQASQWGFNERSKIWGVPPREELKIGALVVIRSNLYGDNGEFIYVNGDTGHIREFDGSALTIELVRGPVVEVNRIVRAVSTREEPGMWEKGVNGDGSYLPRIHYLSKSKRWVTGQVSYFPIMLGYATTVHRSQGLTLDRVQYDFRHKFAREPGISYVALSRCKTLEGLRLVGPREMFPLRCVADRRVARWL
jgi:ATP-dependent DNA helicase PIF1